MSYLMAMIGSAIGVGNIWRFPKVIYANGGSSFLIPYICAFLIMGLSIMLLENTMGYKFRAAVPKIINSIKTKYEFIGWFILFSVFIVLSYYVCIMGWDLIYLILSFTKGWGADPNLFFSQTLLHSTSSISGISSFAPIVLISIIIVWILIFLISQTSINKGIGTVCKILIPVLIGITVVIVIFALNLPGASIGYSQLLNPDWSALTKFDVWLAAFGQIVFSLGLGEGIIIAYAVYLPEGTDLVKNTAIVASTNSGFEIFNAFGIFSILGFMTFTSGIPFNQLITDGSGLAFIVFPQIFNIMGPWAYLIGPLFFAGLFFAGVTSAVALMEPIVYGLIDKFNLSRRKSVLTVCGISFIVSLLFATHAGSMLLNIFDLFASEICLLLAIILECILCGWIYNMDDMVKVNAKKPNILSKIWKNVIKYLIPIFIGVLWVNGVYHILYKNPTTQIILLILAVFAIIIPIVLSKLPAKNPKYYEIEG